MSESNRQEETLPTIDSGELPPTEVGSDAERVLQARHGVVTPEASRFLIRKPFAKGGLGIVFVAHDRQLNRDVALKQIRNDRRDSEQLQHKFFLEAEITGQLEHPGVVPVYSLGLDAKGNPFYAMKFVRGTELKERIRKHHESRGASAVDYSGVEFRQLIKRFQDVCNTIAYAHSRGILHRDLKPANVMLGAHGETLVVDWGLAKLLGPTSDSPVLDVESSAIPPGPVRVRSSGADSATEYGSFSGTIAYAPPEQLLGQLDRLGPTSDVYSLGAILFELLTNSPPMRGQIRALADAVEAIRLGVDLDPRGLVRQIPLPLAMICRKAMAFSQEDRYASALELSEDLDRWLADERVFALGNREPWPERVGRLLRKYRNWTVSVAAALVFSALVMGIGSFLINRARVSERIAKESERDARKKESLNKQEAIRRNAIARDAIDTLLLESSRALADFPATRDLQKRLLSAAAADYARLSEGDSRDEGLQLERLRALVRVADIEAMQGDMTGSDMKYADVIETIERLAPELATDPEAKQRWQLELAKTVARRALALDVSDRSDDAHSEYERAMRLLQEMSASDSTFDPVMFVLARTRAQHADLISRTQGAAAAIELLRQSIRELQRVDASREPRSIAECRKAQESLARNLGMLGRWDEAAEQLESLWNETNAPGPSLPDRGAQETAARVAVSLANVRRQQGDLTEAIRDLQLAAKEYAALRSDWPDSLEYLENQAIVWLDLGLLMLDCHRPAEGKPYLELAQGAFEPLSQNYPAIVRYSLGLGVALQGLGHAAVKTDRDPNVAVTWLEQSRDLLQAVSAVAGDASTIESLVATLGQLGQAYERAGSLELARGSYQIARDYYAPLREQRPDEPRLAFGLAELEWRIGGLELQTGNATQARELRFGAVRRMQLLVERFPTNRQYLVRLACFLARVSMLNREALNQDDVSIVTRAIEQPADEESAIPETLGLQARLAIDRDNPTVAQDWLQKFRGHVQEWEPFDLEFLEWIAELESLGIKSE